VTPENRVGTVSPRLLLIYSGLCAIALGVFLYSVFCPPEIKRYDSPNAYVREDGPTLGDLTYTKMVRRIERAFLKRTTQADAVLSISSQPEEQKHKVMHLHYDILDKSNVLTRWLIAALYGAGLFALAVPSLGVFWRVMKILYPIVTTNFWSLF
jgi:hypothetical protein